MTDEKVLLKSAFGAGLIVCFSQIFNVSYEIITGEHLIEFESSYDWVKLFAGITGGTVLTKALMGERFIILK